ncbi:MAG TPA: hypothetical protein VFP84_26680 [Kofleriaceae bacterium]|nr:hypothetical protein [Kofleriaceae bacterium]
MLAAALAACGGGDGGGAADGGECDAATPCGTGLVCDLTDPAGARCIDATGDLDGDGIPNAMDKCEHMAGGMFDEDGDGIGDECDACPIAKPPKTAETDGDGVDAPCDPNPTMPGDKIVLFNGFNNNAIPDGWLPSSADWTVVGGEAIVTPTTGDLEQLVAPITAGGTQLALLSAYRVDTINAGTNPQVGVQGIVKLPMGNQVYHCGSVRSDSLGDQLSLDANGATAFMPFAKGLFDPAGLYRLAENLQGASADCAVVTPTESGAVTANRQGFLPTQAGFEVRGAKARFEYLLVVSSGGK